MMWRSCNGCSTSTWSSWPGATGDVEQQVELVQVSSHSPDHLTGLQAHQFGAFYRPSWRMNDWLHGRMDGANDIVRILLSPERLRQLGTPPDRMLEMIRSIAVDAAEDHDRVFLAREWDRHRDACLAELTAVADTEHTPSEDPASVRRADRQKHPDQDLAYGDPQAVWRDQPRAGDNPRQQHLARPLPG